MGEMPHWFRIQQAARYLRVPPWDLEEQPLRYLLQAEAAQDAEHSAQKAREKNHRR